VGQTELALEAVAQVEPVAETLKEHQAAEVSQRPIGEGKVQCSRAFAHGPERKKAVFGRMTKPSLKVRVLSLYKKTHFDCIGPMFSQSHTCQVTLF
jgi:diadenosine tetraphosphatase ApaH/serine/threonine PP2A family protein phosphatase